MTPRLLKPVLLGFALVATIWILVFAYWHTTARTPTAGEVVRWLVALPMVLLAACGLVRVLRPGDSKKDSAAHPGSGRSQPSSVENATVTKEAQDAERGFRLAVLAARLRTPQGSTAAELVEAIAAGKMAEPDPELRRSDGLPLFACRIQDVEVDELRDRLGDLAATVSPEIGVEFLADDRLRTIAFMSDVLVELLGDAAEVMDVAPSAKPRAERTTTSLPLAPLRVSVVLPAWWAEQERLLTMRWLQQLSATENPGLACRFDCFAASPEAGAFSLLDLISLTLNRESEPSPWIVLAAESAISESRVAQWEMQGLLHLNERQPGWMAGEAAAGILVTSDADARHANPDAVWLARPAFGRLDLSADTARVSNATLLGTLADQLLAVAGLEANAVHWVVSDADHRPSRLTEVVKLLQDKLPQVDFESRNFSIGAVCAHTGVAAEVVGLVLGCHLAQENRQVVLVASLQDAHARGAALLSYQSRRGPCHDADGSWLADDAT